MRYFFVNSRLPAEIERRLSVFGVCVPLPPSDALPFPVSHHPDMLMAKLGDTLFVHREYQKGQEILCALGIPFVVSEKTLGACYPEDIALNCFMLEDFLFAGRRGASETVLAWAKTQKKTVVFVKQGYAKCASVVVGGAVASADRGIVKAASDIGLPALLLPTHPIGIERYDTGFLGGACGMIDADTLGFFGKIEAYPAYEMLRDFFAARGVRLLSLSEEALFDYGGMLTVEI